MSLPGTRPPPASPSLLKRFRAQEESTFHGIKLILETQNLCVKHLLGRAAVVRLVCVMWVKDIRLKNNMSKLVCVEACCWRGSRQFRVKCFGAKHAWVRHSLGQIILGYWVSNLLGQKQLASSAVWVRKSCRPKLFWVDTFLVREFVSQRVFRSDVTWSKFEMRRLSGQNHFGEHIVW